MRIGIIGSEGSGKSSLFRILVQEASKKRKGYFSSFGVMEIEDERVLRLSEILQPKKRTFPKFEVYDFDGFGKLWKEERAGEIMQSLLGFDLLIQVVGNFAHFDPLADFDSIDLRLILSDLSFVSERVKKLEKERGKRSVDEEELDLLRRIEKTLESEIPISSIDLTEKEVSILAGFNLLTRLPRIVLINREEKEVGEPLPSDLTEKLRKRKIEWFESPLPLEEELLQLGDDELREEFGIQPLSKKLTILIKKSLRILFFYTVVKDEVRGWILKEGSSALDAAGKIHTDMAKGFIRAEVISYEKLIEAGTLKKAREMGFVRLEGKDYHVKDGDILYIKFSK